jgi:redox-sensitive bicupin YhaK (pirin superfamily)
VRASDVDPIEGEPPGEVSSAGASAHPPPRSAPPLEVAPSSAADVSGHPVRRALPRRGRRTVGAWCFVDHLGPTTASGAGGIGPHPHIGLQTVTWLLEGELLHRDSLGSEQLIRPGQLNLMTAGQGVAHAEEATALRGRFHAVQLWVAQPERTRHGAAALEHHAELPRVELGPALATVLVGGLAGVSSPARRDTDHVGIDIALDSGSAVVPVHPDHEHAVVVLDGALVVDGRRLEPGHLGYLGPGRDEVALAAIEPTRALVVGGAPFEAAISMWWNFVARAHDEISVATLDWNTGADRFGTVRSALPTTPAPLPPWEPGAVR